MIAVNSKNSQLVIAFLFLFMLLCVIIAGPFEAGMYVVCINMIRKQPITYSDFFIGFKRMSIILQAIIVFLISFILQWAIHSLLVLFIISEPFASAFALTISLFYISMVFAYTVPLLVELPQIGTTKALWLSLRVVHNNIRGQMVLHFTTICLIFIGGLCLGLGVFVTIPVLFLLRTVAFREIFGLLST